MSDRIVRIILRGDVAGFKASMAAASASVAETTAAITAADKKGRTFRSGLTSLGSTAGKVGLVAAGGLIAVTKAAADFQEKMALVQTLSHANAAQMKELSAAAMSAGKDIGFTASQVADGEAEMIKAGVSLKDIMGGGLTGALNLAAAGQTSVADATSIAAAALTQFQLKGKDIPHLADLLAAGADKALGSVQDLGQGLTQVGTTAHQMGLSVEDTTGTLAEFAQAGLIGERGGTTFKQMLLQLSAPTTKARKLMDQYGVSIYDAAGNMKSMPEIAGNLQQSFSKLDPAARNAALGIIFGSRAIQGANILIKDGAAGNARWIRSVNDQGFAAQQAAGKMNSLNGDLQKLKASVINFAIDTGNSGQGPLRGIVQGTTKAIDALDKLPPSAKSASVALLGITAVGGGGLWFASKIVRGVAESRLALQQLGVSAGATRTALAGIAKGIEFAAILAGISLLDSKLQDLMHANLDNSTLSRSLTNLAETGHVTGTLAQTFGTDLSKFGNYAVDATSGLEKFTNAIAGWAPGDTQFAIATRNIKSVDEALAQMVEGGNAKQAKELFNTLAASAEKQGVSMKDFRGLFTQYGTAMSTASAEAKKAAGAQDGFASATQGAGQAAQLTASQINDNITAMQKDRQAALGAFDAQTQYRQALKDARAQAAKNSAGIKGSSDAALANRGALSSLAAAWNGLNAKAQNAPGAFHQAKQAFVDVAQQMGMTRKAAIDLANRILAIPPKRETEILLNDSGAVAGLKSYTTMLENLNGRIATTYLRQVTQHVIAGGGHPTAPGSADGGTVTGAPRQPYGDKVLYHLAPGEEIISNRHGQADKNRAALKAANQGARLAVVGYADGGTTGTSTHLTAAEKKKKAQEAAAKRKAAAAAAHQRALSLQGYDNSFDLAGGLSIQRVNSELASFSLSVHRLGDRLGKDFGHLSAQARSTAREYLKGEAALKKETAARDALVQARDSAVQSSQGAFTSDVFSGGLGGMSFMLGLDTKRASAFDAALTAAKAHGLSGGLAQGLAASGNLQLAQQFAQLNPTQIAAYEKQYGQRQQALAQLGSTTGSFFAPQIAAANAQIKAQQATLKQLNATMNKLEHAIEKGIFRPVHVDARGNANPDQVGRKVAKHLRHHGKG
ncbi:MAG TPA: phage tail tape measure protein [Mycobacteriales bacterium]|nr:phage tail tape measure protein [Mycobacteriales bacterium]